VDVLFVVLFLGVIGVVAALLAGRLEARLSPAVVSRPRVGLPAQDVTADDIEALRFSPGLRGYRMDEVDAVLDQLATQLTDLQRRVMDQDRQIATLRASGFHPGMTAVDATARDQPAQRSSVETPAGGYPARPPTKPTAE
jgi:DivIVA domain-containing protein